MRTDMIPVSETELFQYCLNSNSLTNCLIKTFLSLYNKKKKKKIDYYMKVYSHTN